MFGIGEAPSPAADQAAMSSLSAETCSSASTNAGGRCPASNSRTCRSSVGTYLLTNSCAKVAFLRSEEHTSELQSRENLVCRLLLEKKNIVKTQESTLSNHYVRS